VLSIDGLGLHSEVTYFDPTLAARMIEEEVDGGLPVAQAARKTAWLPGPNIVCKAESIFVRIAHSLPSSYTPGSRHPERPTPPRSWNDLERNRSLDGL
jgi:hypothetical protein